MKVPEGWKELELGSLGSIVTGTTPPTADETNYGSDYPFVSPADLDEGKYVSAAAKGLSSTGWDRSRQLPVGAVMFTCIGLIGKTGLASVPLATNQQLNSVICDDRFATCEYTYYALTHDGPRISAKASTSVVPIITKGEFQKLKILLPPLPEQRRIAEILSAWDEAIALVERRLAAARERKRGLAQRLLTGQVRFPGFTEPWREVRLGEVAELRGGYAFAPALQGRQEGEYPFIKVSDMNLPLNTLEIVEAANWVSAHDLEKMRAAALPKGSVVFAKIGEGLRQNRVRRLARSTVVDNNMMGAVPAPDRVDSRFFYHAMSVVDLARIAGGTSLPYLTAGSVSSIRIRIPSTPEQVRVAAALDTLDEGLAVDEQRVAALQAQKKGLMQRLLTGDVRVRV